MSAQHHAHAVCQEVVRRLQGARLARGLSKFAVATDSGLSPQMIGYIEQGKRNPTLESALRIARALDIDLGTVIQEATQAVAKSGRKSQ